MKLKLFEEWKEDNWLSIFMQLKNLSVSINKEDYEEWMEEAAISDSEKDWNILCFAFFEEGRKRGLLDIKGLSLEKVNRLVSLGLFDLSSLIDLNVIDQEVGLDIEYDLKQRGVDYNQEDSFFWQLCNEINKVGKTLSSPESLVEMKIAVIHGIPIIKHETYDYYVFTSLFFPANAEKYFK